MMPKSEAASQKKPVDNKSSHVSAFGAETQSEAVPDFALVSGTQTRVTQQNILQLQRLLGNQATRTMTQPVIRSAPTGMIQRNPELIASLEKQIKEREEKNNTLKGKPKQRNNAQIRKLREQLEGLRGETIEPEAEPEQEPEAPKEPTFAEKYPGLAGSLKEDEIKALFDTLGDKGLTGVMGMFTATELKEMYDAFGPAGIGDLPQQFGKDIAVSLVKNLTAAKLNDLMSAYPPTTIKNMLKDLGIDTLKDLMNTFTGEQFKTYVTVVGAPRLITLMKTKKLKASALKKYGAAWLKTFVGANAATMNHLLGIDQRMDTGVITGGHDTTVFRPFLAQIIGSYTEEDDDGNDQTYDVRRGRITYSNVTANYEKVSYKTHTDDGYDWAAGSKTLIKNLQANQAAWLKKANEAIWNAIAAETFDPDVAAWSGTSDDGTTFNGFYNKPKVAVDTFFPV